MKKTFTIETTLHINEYAGLKVSRVRNDNITCSEIPRALIKPLLTGQKISNESDIQELRKRNCTGLYFLVNYRDLRIHIKKTNSILESIFSEAFEGDKKTWFHYVLFFKRDFPTSLTQIELDYIEWYFIEKVVVSGLNKKNNQIVIDEPKLDEVTQKSVDKIIRSINILLMESPLKLHSSEIANGNYDDDSKYGSPISNAREYSRGSSGLTHDRSKTNLMNREEKFENIVSSVMNRNIMNFKKENLIPSMPNMDSIRRKNVTSKTSDNNLFKKEAASSSINSQWKISDVIKNPTLKKEETSKDWASKFFNKSSLNKDLNDNTFKINNLIKEKENFSSNFDKKISSSNFNRPNQTNDNVIRNNIVDQKSTISKINNFSNFNPGPNQENNFPSRQEINKTPIRKTNFEPIRNPDSFFDKPKNEALFDYLNQNEKKIENNQIDLEKSNKEIFKCQKAKGYYNEGFITLIEGSVIKKAKLDAEKMDYNQASVRIRYKEQNEWLENNYIKQINIDEYMLISNIKDIPINIATQHVIGEIGIDGKEYWTNYNDETIHDIERKV